MSLVWLGICIAGLIWMLDWPLFLSAWNDAHSEDVEIKNKKNSKAERKEYLKQYKETENDSNYVHLTFSQFHSYYALNPDSWRLLDGYARKVKPGATKSSLDNYNNLANEYGELITDAVYCQYNDLFYYVSFSSFEDYCKYREFKRDEDRRIKEEEENRRERDKQEKNKKITTDFLNAIQHDIDDMRKLSKSEYDQALDTFQKVSNNYYLDSTSDAVNLATHLKNIQTAPVITSRG